MTDEQNNTGHLNTGDYNTGHRNTGDWNTGNYNTGDFNTGHFNTGHFNTGHRNTGHFNTGDWDDFRAFDKPVSSKAWNDAKKPKFLSALSPVIIEGGKIVGTRTLQAHFAELWANASAEERQLYLDLPNHDPEVSAKLWNMPVSAFQAKPQPPREIVIEGARYVLADLESRN